MMDKLFQGQNIFVLKSIFQTYYRRYKKWICPLLVWGNYIISHKSSAIQPLLMFEADIPINYCSGDVTFLVSIEGISNAIVPTQTQC
jgi:hypothetical protein